MSIGAALTNALSGLNATSRGVELVSSNVANASTPGYGRREIELTSRTLGATGSGVQVAGVTRNVDQALLNDRRIADAAAGDAGPRADFLSKLEAVIGAPDDGGSLGGRTAAFDTALIEAASMPNSEPRLAAVLDSAKALAGQINRVSDTIQTARQDADKAIDTEVGQVNDALARIAQMNLQIRSATAGGTDASALKDQRQQLIDTISAIVPLREVARDCGQVALLTTGGATLLDGRPATLGFTPVATVTADMTLASGALSGFTLNGQPVSTAALGLIGGGSLAAHFALRDEIAPGAQAQIDGLARDLIGRFADPAVDPTLAAGDAGLFTDAGSAFDLADEAGLAGRLQVNDAADPARGGALWHLRDGLNATTPGPVGNSATLTAMADALSAPRVAASGGISSAARSLSGLAADFLSRVGTARQSAEGEASYASARADSLRQTELEGGVDTDQEMQKLIVLEQSFGANAKVMKTLDELIQTLLGM